MAVDLILPRSKLDCNRNKNTDDECDGGILSIARDDSKYLGGFYRQTDWWVLRRVCIDASWSKKIRQTRV